MRFQTIFRKLEGVQYTNVAEIRSPMPNPVYIVSGFRNLLLFSEDVEEMAKNVSNRFRDRRILDRR